jgi:signal transduction histidine kinase
MPSQWPAVGAGSDPLTRARELQRSWERLLADGALGPELPPGTTPGVRPTIVESWRRSLATGLDPTDLLAPIEADESEVLDRWFEHPLGSLTHVLTDQLLKVAEESRSMVVLTDASGLVLHRVGDEWLKERAAEMNLVEGARYSEAADGTNGIGTALAADRAFQVFAFEHFNERHHEWACAGAPVHDPVSGRVVGLVDLSSLWKVAHPRSLQLVAGAARTMEQRLLEVRRDQDARLRRRYGDLMRRSTDLLVNRDGYVLAGARPAESKLLDMPAGGGEVVLDDGSVAMAASFGQGEAYLLRRVRKGQARFAPPAMLESAERHVRELVDEQAALRQVATLVAREPSPDQLFAAVAKQVARVFDVPHVKLVRYEPDGSVVVAGFSEGDDEPFAIGSRWPHDVPGVTAIVRQTGRPARVENYARLTGEIAAVARGAGMRSSVASPIVVERRLWGAMVVLSPLDELPDSTEARLTDFTELVATAIANAEARDALARLADEQAALRRVATFVAQGASPRHLFEAVAEEVGRLLPVGSATMGRFEPDGSVTTVASWSSTDVAFPTGRKWPTEGTNVARMVLQTGRSARIDDFSAASGPIGVAAREAGTKSAIGSPVIVEGRLWGVMTATSNEGPMPPGTEARLASFTDLVATAIANAESSAELAASRRRIVAASDEARRQIERNLHDGMQQRLVALGLAVRTAEANLPPGADDLRAELSGVAMGLLAALEDLQEISRGIHPAILSRGGLGPALQALAHRSTIPVALDIGTDVRLDEPIEVAAYFVASEALANAAKHSRASRIDVSLEQSDRSLLLSVRDDGVGGADAARGSGLVGLTDRVEALGGSLRVVSRPGDGTRVTVELPVGLETAVDRAGATVSP